MGRNGAVYIFIFLSTSSRMWRGSSIFICCSDSKFLMCKFSEFLKTAWQEMVNVKLHAYSPEDGNGNPLQYSCLENFMGRGAWHAYHSSKAALVTDISNQSWTDITTQSRHSSPALNLDVISESVRPQCSKHYRCIGEK